MAGSSCLIARWLAATMLVVVAACSPLTTAGAASAAPAVSPELRLSDSPSEPELGAVRIFSEPLVPVDHKPSVQENQRLAAALHQHQGRGVADDFSALEDYLQSNPESAWAPAVRLNLASEYYNTGWYSKALEAWRTAWPLLKNQTVPQAKALGDRAAGELAYMLARLGRMSELGALLDEVKGRVFIGSATEKIAGAHEGLWTMQHRPETAFKCGPYALGSILAAQDPRQAHLDLVRNEPSTTNGCSLRQVADLSQRLGMGYQMAFRSHGAALVLPAVINWKAGHYAALLRKEGELYLLKDPTFGNSTWVSERALEHEASGYFLVPPGQLPAGWRTVSATEGATVFGKGQTSSKDNTATTPADTCNCDNGSGSYWSMRGFLSWLGSLGEPEPPPVDTPMGSLGIRGMANFSVELALVSLNLRDIPVGYTPPFGPAVNFIATYNQRDAGQPANFSYSNLGPKWTFNWLAFIADNPSSPSADVSFYTDGGGNLPFTGFNSTNQTFAAQMKTGALLRRTSTNSYELLQGDGSRTIFAQPDSVGGTSRHVFMTQLIDPAGNTVTISYDGSFRVTAVTDAIGQVTSLSYTNVSNPLKITQVTDPFGRSAIFTYDTSSRLAAITDTLGMTSQFTYDSGDFVQALTTPYGTTTFQKGGIEPQRWLVTTYPDGEQDRVEFLESGAIGIAAAEPAALVPTGMSVGNEYLIYRNTFYWDRNAYAQAPSDYTKARLYHWLHLDGGICSSVLESERPPLEDRIWFTYDGQTSPIFLGTSAKPNAIGRVLDDGSTQLRTVHYNALGRVTNSVDPVGRSTTFIYSTNLVDLLEVHQTTGGNDDLVGRFLYNTQHLAVATWDAAGQMTTNTYNARGELLSTTSPKGQTTTFTYDTNGYLTQIDGPLPGPSDSVFYAYDGLGRVRTYTDLDGYTRTYAYDALDRLTNVTYPDGTYVAIVYDKLDRVQVRDRLGRTTHYTYDALRQLTSVQDPLKRTTSFQYCGCGGLAALVDALGRPTRWTHDIQGRITSKTYVDGSGLLYSYETNSSRLKSVQDEKGEIKLFSYTPDDDVSSVSCLLAQVPTPGVTYTYDPSYRRLASMQDGVGTTTFSYYPAGVLGALRLASVDGPWPNDTVTYQYDELGETTNRAINGVAQSYAYDVLGRVSDVANALGSFHYDFDGATARVRDQLNPNGQSAHYTYFGNAGDRRLQSIVNLKPDTSLISRFNYSYDADGEVTNWLQVLGNQTNDWALAYDPAGQLLGVQINPGSAPTNYGYAYDLAGNRLLAAAALTNLSQYNNLNQLVTCTDTSLTNAGYEWDSEGRLNAVNLGTARSEFSYDGYSRCCRIVEKTNGVVLSERRYVWCQAELCEERDATDTVTRRFFPQGFTSGGTSYFFTRDHLGSVRELVDGSAQVQSRYQYDPYGRRNPLVEAQPSPFGFTGFFLHAPSGLNLALLRAYDANLGRWLSRDPLGEAGGLNLYGYGGNDPINQVDPLGLCWRDTANALWQQAVTAEGKAQAWLAEHAKELAQKTVEAGEIALQFIAEEASRFGPGGVIAGISMGPSAATVGTVNAVTESLQLQQAVQMSNDDLNGKLNPNAPVIPAAQAVQNLATKVH